MIVPESFTVKINDRVFVHLGSENDRLLDLLHDQGLCASKLGCASGHCGACTVWVNDSSVHACETNMGSICERSPSSSKTVTTLEGLRAREPALAQCLSEAFLEEQAAQCGYCTSGILMRAASFIKTHAERRQSDPTALKIGDTEIAQALNGHLCRCGSHRRVIRAVKLAYERYVLKEDVTPELQTQLPPLNPA
jgi:nicotinate dehydrogenase subunit A